MTGRTYRTARTAREGQAGHDRQDIGTGYIGQTDNPFFIFLQNTYTAHRVHTSTMYIHMLVLVHMKNWGYYLSFIRIHTQPIGYRYKKLYPTSRPKLNTNMPTIHNRRDRQDRTDMTGRTYRTDRTGGTGREGQAGQDRHDRQDIQDSQDRQGRTGRT